MPSRLPDRSERLLMRHANDRLSVRWYVGYDLDEPLPDHSSLTRIRTRYGVEMFRRFFEAIVDQCQQAGLVWGKELYVDATKVNANASMESVKPRFAVAAHLANLFAAETEKPAEEVEQASTQDKPASSEPNQQEEMASLVEFPIATSPELGEELRQQNEQRHNWIEQVGKPDRKVIRGTYRRMADFVVSTTDPDATVMPTKGEGRHLGYHTHYVVDGGKARIIMAVLVTPSEVMENQPMRGSASSARASAGNCGRARPPGTRPTAPSTISWRLNTSAFVPTFPCPTLTNGLRSTDSGSSSMIPNRMPIPAQTEPCCVWKCTATPNGPSSIELMQLLAMLVLSKSTAPPVSRDDPSDAASMTSTSSGSATLMRPSRIKKPCASAAAGRNRYRLRANTGIACGAFVSDDSGASSVRHSCERLGKI